MAKVVHSSFVESIHGRSGNLIYRHVYGSTRVGPRHNHRKNRERGAAEAATNDRFSRAVARAKAASPEMCARYLERARQLKKPAFGIRVADYLTPPTIESLNLAGYSGCPGEPILVRATDDFEVKDVHVRLRLPDGATLEEGFARRLAEGSDAFLYRTQAAPAAGTEVTIEVTARDWPRNKTVKQAAFVCPRR